MSRSITRRVLILAGTAALMALAGCGGPREPQHQDGETTQDGLTYDLSRDGTASLTGKDGDGALYGDISVPATVTSGGLDYEVRSVAANALQEEPLLQDLALPDTVREIGKRAFYRSGVSSISGAGGLETIAEEAFSGCDLVGLDLPGTLTSVGKSAFAGNDSLESVSFEDAPGSGLTIGESCFQGTPVLATIHLPQGMESLGAHALGTSDLVTEVVVPDGVTELGEGCLGLPNLTTLALPGSVGEVGRVGPTSWRQLTSVSIAEGVGGLEGTFRGSQITGVDVPGTVKAIGDGTFSRCLSLASVTLHEGTETIGDDAFASCPLTEVSVPDTVTSIGARAFSGAPLHALRLGSGLTSIGDEAFMRRATAPEEAPALTECVLPDGLTSIGARAFKGNDGLAVTVPDSVGDIGDDALAGCVVTATTGSYAYVWCEKNGVEVHGR